MKSKLVTALNIIALSCFAASLILRFCGGNAAANALMAVGGVMLFLGAVIRMLHRQ